MRAKLFRCMQDQDRVVEFTYCDAQGNRSRRVVSPIRFLPNGRFLGLCLSREEPRQFYLTRCEQLDVKPAADYLMPVAL